MSTTRSKLQGLQKDPKVEQSRIQNILRNQSKSSSAPNEPSQLTKDNNDISSIEPSPRKRQLNNSSTNLESPSKRLKKHLFINGNADENYSPKQLQSIQRVKTLSSTPRPKYKLNSGNSTKTTPNDSINSEYDEKIERNLSKSWADIMDDLEEQANELKNYKEKLKVKYKMSENELLNSVECDTEVLRKRQRQINYGKTTQEYKRYIDEVQRRKREKYHPKTPNKFRKCSRRRFDGLIRKWRKLLHAWDVNPDNLKELNEEFDANDDDDDGADGNNFIDTDMDSFNEDVEQIDENEKQSTN